MEILFENDKYVAINKPSGLVVHSDGRTEEKTVVDWFIENYPNSVDVGEDMILSSGDIIKRPGVVHRLDRDTSGVLILAKTKEGYKFLKKSFKRRDIQKTYNAFVYGVPKEERGIINRPIAKSKGDFRRWTTGSKTRGKEREAITIYKVVKSGKGVSFLEIFPKTGRTHQIRVHLNSINHPVIGDNLYAPNLDKKFNLNRLALHARAIKFKDFTGEDIFIEAPFPEDFNNALKELK